MDKIIITGCNGFIGRNLLDYYLNKNYYIIGIDKNINKIKKNKNLKLFKGDVGIINLPLKEVKDVKFIIFLSGLSRDGESINNPILTYNENVINLIKFTDKVYKNNKNFFLIYTSTIQDETKVIKSPYAISKIMSEETLKFLSYNKNLKIFVLKLSDVIGDKYYNKNKYIYKLINNLKLNRNIEKLNKLHNFNYILIEDVIRSLKLIEKNINKHKNYTEIRFKNKNIFNLLNIVKYLKKYLNSKSKINTINDNNKYKENKYYIQNKKISKNNLINKFF